MFLDELMEGSRGKNITLNRRCWYLHRSRSRRGGRGTKVDTQTDIANPAKFLKLQDKRSKVFSYYKMQSRLDLKLEKCRYKTNGQKTKNGVNANLEQVLNKLAYSFSNFVVFLQYIGRLRDTLFQCHTAPYSQISDGNTTATEQRQNTSS